MSGDEREVLTKDKIARAVEESLGLSVRASRRVVADLLEVIKRALERGEIVKIKGFGKWKTVRRGARTGKNPRTGEAIEIEPGTYVQFTASRALKRKMSGRR